MKTTLITAEPITKNLVVWVLLTNSTNLNYILSSISLHYKFIIIYFSECFSCIDGDCLKTERIDQTCRIVLLNCVQGIVKNYITLKEKKRLKLFN